MSDTQTATIGHNNPPPNASRIIQDALRNLNNGAETQNVGRGELAHGITMLLTEAADKGGDNNPVKSIEYVAANFATNKSLAGYINNMVLSAADLAINNKAEQNLSQEARNGLKTQRELVRNGLRLALAIVTLNHKHKSANTKITYRDATWHVPGTFLRDVLNTDTTKIDLDQLARVFPVRRAPYFLQANGQSKIAKASITYDTVLRAVGKSGTGGKRTPKTPADVIGEQLTALTTADGAKVDFGDVSDPESIAARLIVWVVNKWPDAVNAALDTHAKEQERNRKAEAARAAAAAGNKPAGAGKPQSAPARKRA